MRTSLSARLRLAIGLEEKSPPQFLENSQELVAVIDDICQALKDTAAEAHMNLEISDSVVVNCLFYRVYHEDQSEKLQKEWMRATIVCILQFLEWCKEELIKGKLERRWLYDFDFDIRVAKILGTKYSEGFCGRTRTNNTLFQYSDICALLTGKYMPQPITRDMLALFGIRQLLEAKFRRIIGLNWLEPMLKIPHGVIPKILRVHERELKFKSEGILALDSVMHIYDWTDYSIHTMSTNYTWLVWKAVFAVKYLFCQQQHEGASYFHINGSIEISDDTLEKLREDFRRWVSANIDSISKEKYKQVKIYWGAPEIPVFNCSGQLVKIGETCEMVFNCSRVRQIKQPSIFLLIDQWPNDDLADVLRQNITALHNCGVKISIIVRNRVNAGFGALGVLSIPWKCIEADDCSISGESKQIENYCKEQDITTIIDLGIANEIARMMKNAAEIACPYEIEYMQGCADLTARQGPEADKIKVLYEHLYAIANKGKHLERDIEVK